MSTMPASSPSQTIRIFFSYATTAPQDRRLFGRLLNHLSLLRRSYSINAWYDSAISFGDDIAHVQTLATCARPHRRSRPDTSAGSWAQHQACTAASYASLSVLTSYHPFFQPVAFYVLPLPFLFRAASCLRPCSEKKANSRLKELHEGFSILQLLFPQNT